MTDSLPNCPACAVRQLTEGNAPVWHAQNPGEAVTGVVMKIEPTVGPFEVTATAITLWLGETSRVRVIGFGVDLARKIEDAAPQVGDSMTIRYLGRKPIERGRMVGRAYREFSVTVTRGHH